MSANRSKISDVIAAHLAVVMGGTPTRRYLGRPTPHRTSAFDTPYAVYWIEQPKTEPFTYGTSGSDKMTTICRIRIYLGAADMPEATAENNQLQYADLLRYDFAQDPTVGGYCLDSTLSGGAENLATYKAEGEMPYVEYELEMVQTVQRNAVVTL